MVNMCCEDDRGLKLRAEWPRHSSTLTRSGAEGKVLLISQRSGGKVTGLQDSFPQLSPPQRPIAQEQQQWLCHLWKQQGQ